MTAPVKNEELSKILPQYIIDDIKAVFAEIDTREYRKTVFSVRLLYRDELAKLFRTSFQCLPCKTAWAYARQLTDVSGRSMLSQKHWATALEHATTASDCFERLSQFSTIV